MKNLDSILIKNLDIFSYHGLNGEENVLGQHFVIDAIIFVKSTKNFFEDDIDKVISIAKLVKDIKNIVTNCRYNLIETLAERICKEMILKYSLILKIDITVKKPNAPIKDVYFDYVGVHILRERCDYLE